MLTKELQETLRRALEYALERRHEFLLLEHLLLAMLDDTTAQEILAACGADMDGLRTDLTAFLEEQVESLPEGTDVEPQQTLSFQRVLQRAAMHVRSAGRESLNAGNLLVSMFREPESYAIYSLGKQDITRFDVVNYVSHGITKSGAGESARRSAAPSGVEEDGGREDALSDPLENFCTELVAKAADGKIDPLIGREKEVERTVQVLLRRRKNNPVFVGDPGVGKTAIAEGIALRIHSGDVPDQLKDAKLYSLNMASMLAGTRYRGDFEERVKALMEELKQEPNAILFIDEIHTVVGAGATSGGTMDASNMLKPALAAGELRCMGSTTYSEYRATFDKDRALARRFQKIDIMEPSVEEAYQILRGLKSRYEDHHGVKYTDAALRAAADLAARHINEQALPDKAIDVIDEAGANEAMKPKEDRVDAIRPPQIEAIVSKIARIPTKTVSTDDKGKLKNLERDLKLLIYGQDHAIEQVSNAITMARAGLREPDKPVGSFLFTGPTGVGKTELAVQLANTLGMEFKRFDMSEYMEKHTVSRLIGAPPGYVGFDQGGLLTDAIRKKPHCVLLLDEIEKAHPDLFNILLQVMDHGKLTDNTGRESDFRSVILIMTSNAGARDMARVGMGFGNRFEEKTKGKNKTIERVFSPEFRNRLDSIVSFHALKKESIDKVVDKFLLQLDGQLSDKRVTLELTDAARTWIGDEGFDPQFGARPMARVIQEHVKKPISKELLFGELVHGGVMQVDGDENGLQFKVLESYEPLPDDDEGLEDDEPEPDGDDGGDKEPVPA
ncbi:MAG: ATP-dependent Clp protease ATP-binding subunit ClpA [Deltaproteobacteria bacterium]|nr:ATP-dependent Clp protease ATP-binding subunit ClpA [Deltaproteobacteria bacterium]